MSSRIAYLLVAALLTSAAAPTVADAARAKRGRRSASAATTGARPPREQRKVRTPRFRIGDRFALRFVRSKGWKAIEFDPSFAMDRAGLEEILSKHVAGSALTGEHWVVRASPAPGTPGKVAIYAYARETKRQVRGTALGTVGGAAEWYEVLTRAEIQGAVYLRSGMTDLKANRAAVTVARADDISQ